MKKEIIKLTFPNGVKIQDACDDASVVAKSKLREVHFEFNGIPISVFPGSEVKALVCEYNARIGFERYVQEDNQSTPSSPTINATAGATSGNIGMTKAPDSKVEEIEHLVSICGAGFHDGAVCQTARIMMRGLEIWLKKHK